MTEHIELMNLYWTDAGLYPGRGEISPRDFETRVKAASRAGLTGIGLWHTDLEHICVHHSLQDIKTILDDNGMKHLELEFLTDWFLEGGRKAESDRRKRFLFEASEALGAKHVKIGDFYNTPCPMPRLIEAFATLCKEAEAYGATIGYEFMASATLASLKDSMAMVAGADAPNGGVIVDIVHVVSQGISYDEVARIPKRYLISVELNDGTLASNPNHDASGARRFCGEGDYDIKGFIAAVRETGYTGPWAVEVFAPGLVDVSLDEIDRRAFETTMAQFEA